MPTPTSTSSSANSTLFEFYIIRTPCTIHLLQHYQHDFSPSALGQHRYPTTAVYPRPSHHTTDSTTTSSSSTTSNIHLNVPVHPSTQHLLLQQDRPSPPPASPRTTAQQCRLHRNLHITRIYHRLHTTHHHQHGAPAPFISIVITTSPRWRKHRVFVTTTTTTITTTTTTTTTTSNQHPPSSNPSSTLIRKEHHLVFVVIVTQQHGMAHRRRFLPSPRYRRLAGSNSLPSTRRHQPTTAI
jgi:hypothetical protein